MIFLLRVALVLLSPASAQTIARPAASAPRAGLPGSALPAAAPSAAAPALTLTPSLHPAAAHSPAAPAPQGAASAAQAAVRTAATVAERLRDTEIVVIHAVQDEKGRPMADLDVSRAVEELIARRRDAVRSLEKDGPANLFADAFAVEVKNSARDEILAELRALQGVEAAPLSELLALGSRRANGLTADEKALASYKERLEKGPLAERWRAFAEVASLIENGDLAQLPEEARDSLVFPLYGVATDAVNAYSSVQGAAKHDLRAALHAARGDENGRWADLEKHAQQGLKHPDIAARFSPLREHLVRALGAIDRLDTPQARAVVLRTLPHADYAGLELAADPSRAPAYARAWLDEITGSLAETRRGLLAPAEEKDWHASQRSGGYTHVEGDRKATHLYQWRPYRQDPAESSHELALMLGLPRSGVDLVEPLLAALDAAQAALPGLRELHKRKTMARELKSVEGTIAYYAKQADDDGKPWTPEQVAEARRQLVKRAEQDYARHDRLDGHSVFDRLLLSFGFRRHYATSIPGFDEAVYAANVLALLRGAARRLTDADLVKQLADGALHFLTELAASPLLDARPDLRASAITAWRELAAKTDSLGIVLRTRLDGVIDPRPEKPLGEPAVMDSVPGDATIWQLAVSPDGRLIAQAGSDRRVRVWNAETRALVKTIELDDARQLYGDLANSLGVSWNPDGRLRVTTLHDVKEENDTRSFNLIRTFDLAGARAVLTGADALSTAVANDIFVLRENSRGPGGAYYASMKEVRTIEGNYKGSEVSLVGEDGRVLSLIVNSKLLDLHNGLLLLTAPGRTTPRLEIWNAANPAQPVDATPAWLTRLASEWAGRHPASEYGWYPSLSARLGSVAGRPALILNDEGRLTFHDLETGAVLRSLEIPAGWTAAPYLTDASGTRLAAVITAPGEFAGPNPERLVAWDMTTGELLMERDATFVPAGWLYSRGQSIAQLAFTPDGRRLIAAGRTGTRVFALP